jgi:hypothetical protein
MFRAGLNALKHSWFPIHLNAHWKKMRSFCPCSRALNRSGKGLMCSCCLFKYINWSRFIRSSQCMCVCFPSFTSQYQQHGRWKNLCWNGKSAVWIVLWQNPTSPLIMIWKEHIQVIYFQKITVSGTGSRKLWYNWTTLQRNPQLAPLYSLCWRQQSPLNADILLPD